MSEAAELKKLVKQLQTASNSEDITTILRTLKKDYKVNEAILRESKAGLAVGKLRTHASKDVSDLAKEIVKQWKTEVEQAKAALSGAGKPAVGVNTAARKGSISTGPATPKTPNAPSPNVRSMASDGIPSKITEDTKRNKCIELMYDALCWDSGAPNDLIFNKAKAIEAAVFSDMGGSGGSYPTKMRSLYVNLKDKNNPSLREAVASGDIPVDKLDMASEERKKADEAIKQQNLHDSLGAEEQQAETDAFQCSRCKQRKCRYRQAQTRSADEPMTTFVTCVNCNNRWKFS
ncbi:transcription elongation factor [Mycena capillaripes]|nr:transcription elongation factor [Mycena capillaripes]